MASIINGESSPNYYVTPTGITIGGRTKEYATIADMLADTNPGKYARVADATGDTTVKHGAAVYRREGTDWVKVYEEESMDMESVITWDTLAGRPNVTAQAVEGAIASAHNHTNYSVISKLGVDTSGNLTLDGNPVGSNGQDASAAIARLDVLEPTVTNLETTVSSHGTDIVALQSQNYVFSVNGVTPDANGSVTIPVGNPNSVLYVDAMPEPSADLVGKVVFYSGASTATFTAGSVYRCILNSNSVYEWKVITDNSEINVLTGLVATNTANISINQDGILANTNAINALADRVITVEGKAHEHNTETNFVFSNEVFGCTEKVETYKTFNEFSLPEEVTFSFMTSTETGYILVGNDKLYWTNSTSSKYNGVLSDLTGGLTNITWAASSNNILAVIADGSMYVRAHDADITKLPAAGTLLGEVETLSKDSWTIIPDGKTWKQVSCHVENWLAIDGNGNLYVAGKNYYGLQLNDETTGVVNSFTLADDSGDWIDIGTGRYHNMGMRGTIDENGVKHGTIYAWGQLWTGAVGNGISYRQDMKKTYAWVNGNTVVHTFSATPAASATVYAFADKMTILGRLNAAASNNTIVLDGVNYTRDSSYDIDPSTLYTKTIIPLAVPTFDANGNVTNTTVYSDWFKMEAGYYHNAALRKNPTTGKTEVYLWGDNEYGQFGNGNYVNGTLTQSTLTEDNAALVELWSWPTKLEDSRFDDAIDVRCAHYGTFIRCASGKIYFAGCNKRNYLGTGTFSEETAFIPYFTELSTMFRNNIPLVSTYGAMVVRNSPRLSDDADAVVSAAFTYPLTPKNLDAAITASHNHSIDTATIDAAAILVSQFASAIPLAASHAHSHFNLADLNAIAVRNGVLYINNNPYGGGSSSSGTGGTGVTVDPTNVKLDSLTDIAGLSNLSGGFGFEVLSYRKVSDSEAYIHVAPKGNVINCQGRYVDLLSSSGTDIISAEEQAKGLYAVCSNSSSNNGYVYCTKDLVTKMEAVAASSSAYLRLYYVDTAHASSPASGTLALELTGATISGYGKMTWKPAVGSVVVPDSKLATDDLQSVGVGSYNNEEVAFQTIYTRGGDALITKEAFEENKYYLEDGREITSVGMISISTGQDENEEPTYSAVYSDSTATTVIIPAETVKAGIFIKDGTMLVQVRPYMVPEKFDEEIFANGAIYIHPGNTNFSGMANQSYTFDSTVYIRETTAVDGVYPIKSAILRLHRAVTDGDPTNTNYTPMAGSLNNPMFAAIYSPNRYSTSSVNGEYNSAVGFNSSATGNQVTVIGDFSNAVGLCNVVSGDMSQTDGLYNTVIGSNSNVRGEFNLVGGAGNYVFGDGNVVCGQYTYAFGNGNMTLGVRGMAIGMKNLTNSDSIAIGRMNTMEKSSKYSIALGSNLTVYAEGATVVGQLASIPKFIGNFPGDNLDDLYSITAAQYASRGYDEKWISNKNGMFFCAGNKVNQDINTVISHAFTEYIVRPNNAFFSAATGSTNRNMDPYIYEPFFQHTFTGVINQQFTDATADVNDATKFTFTQRDGGRVKSFDPGIMIESGATAIDLDFNKATRWKLLDTENTNTLIPKNFVDGAEAYVIVYGGVTVSWTAFEFGGNVDESIDANHFDGIVWAEGEAPRAVDNFAYGFQMIKLMVVDNTVIAQLIADTCSNEPSGAIVNYAMRAEASATEAAGYESDVESLTEQAEELNN